MEELKNRLITIQEDFDAEDKKIQINYNQALTPEQFAIIECIRKLKNPFTMINIDVVMKDLKVCKNVAYKIFQREDFPGISIGKNKQVMLISYLIWKMERREW